MSLNDQLTRRANVYVSEFILVARQVRDSARYMIASANQVMDRLKVGGYG